MYYNYAPVAIAVPEPPNVPPIAPNAVAVNAETAQPAIQPPAHANVQATPEQSTAILVSSFLWYVIFI